MFYFVMRLEWIVGLDNLKNILELDNQRLKEGLLSEAQGKENMDPPQRFVGSIVCLNSLIKVVCG